MSKATKSGADPTISYNPSGGSSSFAAGVVPAPATPERFKDICLRPGGESSRETLAVLDYLFNADTFLDRPMAGVNLIKQYLTGGSSYEAFKNKLKSYDNSSTCGLVWNVSYVAYRCRTCALSPCMSICAECFKNGDHRGHDFNMFRSGAGGACDCGDEYVMNPKGFCKAHGCKKPANAIQPPDDLVKCCELVLAHLLYGFAQAFRKIYSSLDYKLPPNRVHLTSILNELNSYIEMMNELVSLGTPLRTILVDYIINEEYYAKKIQNESGVTQAAAATKSTAAESSHKKEENQKPTATSEATSTSATSEETRPRAETPSTMNNNNQEDDEDDDDEDEDEDMEDEMGPDAVLIRPQNASHAHAVYKKALSMHEAIQVPRAFVHIADQIRLLTTSTIVDELLFWCIRFEFPEPLVKFLVSLLPDQRYKMHFIRSFVSQYSYISVLLLQSKSEHICSRVVHISVQLFSNEASALKALNDCYLLPILLSSFHNMLVTSGIKSEETHDNLLIRSKLEDEVHNKHMVIDPDHPIMQENLYWLVASDLVNLLNHKRVTCEMITRTDHIQLWFQMLTYFQAMNLSVRKFGEHVQQEQPTYFSAFSAELECCSSIMWSFVQHLNDEPSMQQLSFKLLKLAFESIRSWLADIGFVSSTTTTTTTALVLKRPKYKHLTFHLPLHRYLSCIIYNAICIQSVSLNSILDAYFCGNSTEYRQHMLANILAHPLQIQIGFYEIHANMWVRNGMQMKGQAMTYVQNHFCSSFSDTDLFLIQILASQLEPDLFISAFIERFHLLKWLRKSVYERHRNVKTKIKSSTRGASSKQQRSQASASLEEGNNSGGGGGGEDDEDEDEEDSEYELAFNSKNSARSTGGGETLVGEDDLEPAHEIAMLVGALTFLAQLVTIRPNLRLKSYLLTRTEMVYILAVADRTYSQIEENLPDACSLSAGKKLISPILNQISDYLQPTLDLSISNLKQGRYKPKDSIWLKEYDPLYVMMRSVRRREFQESFDRYTQIAEKKLQQQSSSISSNSNKIKKSIWPPFRLPGYDAEGLEEMRAKQEQQSSTSEASNEECDVDKEIADRNRLERELDSRWRILNTKLIHALFLTILYEHHYSTPVTEKVLYFVVYLMELAIYRAHQVKYLPKQESSSPQAEQIIFDEYNYQTWFRSNDLIENLCTYVPFMSCEVEIENEQETEAAMGEMNSLDLNDEQQQKAAAAAAAAAAVVKVPPFKKICSGLASVISKESSPPKTSTSSSSSSSSTAAASKIPTTKRLKKTYTCESILSLLVKIVYASKKAEWERSSTAETTNKPFLLDYDFAKSNNLDKDFYDHRIGDETDFIINVLERASRLDRKCNLIINKTLETLNALARKQIQTDSVDMATSGYTPMEASSSSKDSTTLAPPDHTHAAHKTSPTDDDLKAKKLRAKARQQKLLAQMSTSQKAFLSNPNNKLDVEAFNELSQSLPTESTLSQQQQKQQETAIKTSTSKLEEEKEDEDMLSKSEPKPNSMIEGESKASQQDDGMSTNVSERRRQNKESSTVVKPDEIYDCCICRLSSVSTPDRPIGMVALIQSTSVLGHRESLTAKDSKRVLPLNDEFDYNHLSTETLCWRQEEKRIRNLKEAFKIDSCKYSINIGWKGGVYTQMCGHYLHFDCYNSYKSTLEDQMSHMARISALEYTCPLCRQIANCVLPVAVTATASTSSRRANQSASTSSQAESSSPSKTRSSPPGASATAATTLLWPMSGNTPAKMWILSSLTKKATALNANVTPNLINTEGSSSSSRLTADANSEWLKAFEKLFSQGDQSHSDDNYLYEGVLDMLRARPFSPHDLSSKTLTNCKNDALTAITQATPIEFRYIDHMLTISNPQIYRTESPVDDDIAMFTTSVLRTQLEIDLMLVMRQKQHPNTDNNSMHISNSFNFKKKRACFIPLFDVISTHCRLMCHEVKPHIKLWLMLINPSEWKSMNAFDPKLNIDDADRDESMPSAAAAAIATNEIAVSQLTSSHHAAAASILSSSLRELATNSSSRSQDAPLLLRDPIAILLLIISNLPVNIDKTYFDCIISNVFNLVFVQSVIDLCREFDEEERQSWAAAAAANGAANRGDISDRKTSSNLEFCDYVANVINFLKSSNVFQKQPTSTQDENFYMKTIWTKESAKIYVESKCIHFLRIATLLKSYLYDQDISSVSLNEFESLKQHLNLTYVYESKTSPTTNSSESKTSLLKWHFAKPNNTIYSWMDDLIKASNTHREQVHNLLSLGFDTYNFPQLLELPKLYSDLFSYYLNKRCQFCTRVPKETAICLVCGAQICYKSQYCCDAMKDFNKRHINVCGAGTLILLNINSTLVYIIRSKRCAPWASLYLDEHGEEDRDLKRGKPLYLNEQRYNLLKSSWCSHSFDYQSLKWYSTSMLIY